MIHKIFKILNNMRLTNFFSNIWLITNLDNETVSYQELLNHISKIKQQHNIYKIINFDKEFKFWTNDISSKFNNTITTQIIIENQKYALELYKKYSKLLLSTLINQKQLLIFTIEKNECLIGFILYFICKHGNVKLDKAINQPFHTVRP